MRRSNYPSGLAIKALSVTTISADGVTTGDTVDRYQPGAGRGNFRGGVTFAVLSGDVAEGNHVISVEDSTDGSVWSDASDYDVQGLEPSFGTSDDNTVKEVGYNGSKRYCRLKVTSSGVTALTATLSAVAFLTGGSKRAV